MRRLLILTLTLAALASGTLGCTPGGFLKPTRTPTPRPSPTPVPVPTQMPAIGAARTVCLTVNQAYPEITGEFALPIAETVESMLRGIGLAVLPAETACDLSLTIRLMGTPRGQAYMNVPTGKTSSYCYTGSDLAGEMVIAASGRALLTLPMNARVAPRSGTISTCPSKTTAIEASPWERLLLEGLTTAWGPPVAVDALGSPSARLRHAAFQGLVAIGPQGESALTLALRDDDWAVRVGAASFLQQRKIHSAEIVATLLAALEHEDAAVRAAAAFALGGSPSTDEVVRDLISALQDDAAEVREQAASAFRQMAPQAAAAPALIATLADEDADVREAAAYTLGKIGPQAGVAAALIQALGDEDEWVRGAAATALGDIGPQEGVVPALIQALGDKSRNVRSTVARELKEMTGKDFGQDAARWQAWWDKQQ